MNGFAVRLLPFVLSFFSSLCIMVLELTASRLVARHVGGSLIVWTSVIGIMLGGICLGNVLGGRLADRVAPRRAIGPLYALGALLTLSCLYMNAVVGLTPGLDAVPWNLRTLLVVTLDFLVPGTVLGMIGPVVAKMAVEGARKPGSALGDIYMLGAVGSIVGTFVAGFYLIYLLRTSTIVTLVAASYALLAAAMLYRSGSRRVALGTAVALGAGIVLTLLRRQGTLPGIPLDEVGRDPMALAGQGLCLLGHVLALALGALAWGELRAARAEQADAGDDAATYGLEGEPAGRRIRLGDLAFLSFVASLAFMAFEMVAGRLVQRHLGSSVYGWTSVIGVLLGGLSLGNYLGGKMADKIFNEKQASWLFLFASILTATVLLAESPPGWLVRNPIGHFARGEAAVPLSGDEGSFLSQAIVMSGYPWWARVLTWTTLVFFVPAITLGTVSPVVAKLAVERARHAKQTGSAIGSVYAWGMVGSILGTFATGFFLIDVLGTKGMLLAIATLLALCATYLGSVWHALWAGIPLGLCVIAFTPVPWLEKQAVAWGIREEPGDPAEEDFGIAHVDESNYYYIKVSNSIEGGKRKRTLVLDNLIHGYFIVGHPEQLDYDYEHIYAIVAKRALDAKRQSGDPTAPAGTPLSTLFLGGGSYTFPRYLQKVYPGTACDVAEIDPAVTRANHAATFLPPPLAPGAEATAKGQGIRTVWGDARQFVEKRHAGEKKYDLIFGDAFNDFSVPWHLTTRQFNDRIARMMTDDGIYMINIIDIYRSDAKAREEAAEGDGPFPNDEEASVAQARRVGGFLASWVETAKLTFPHIYVFGTDEPPGRGLRETFVVVAAKKAIDLEKLGVRAGDPNFYGDSPKLFTKYGAAEMDELKTRSRGIILTDDYAPVENLLAPVAATRGDD
jgi:MFS family permease